MGEARKPAKKKMDAPTLSKYFNAEYLVDVIYKNGGIAPGGSGNVMTPSFYGCGVTQEEFHMLLTFYGAMMYGAKKDPAEIELFVEEIGKNLLEHFKLDDEEKAFIKEKFIDKKKQNENIGEQKTGETKTEEKKK